MSSSAISALVDAIALDPAAHPMALTSLVAGGVAGLCTDVSLYPLDTLKTRLQSAVGFRQAGGFRGVYRGLSSAVVGSVPSAALFWCTYDVCKALGHRTQQRRGVTVSDSALHIASAVSAELAACVVRVPVDNVKQKLQAHVYPTVRSTLANIWALDGVLGFYMGTLGTIARDIPFAVIQFPLYEQFKRIWSESLQGKPLDPHKAAVCGSAAGAVAAAITTPMDVIKTRLMLTTDRHGVRYVGVMDVLARIRLHEGLGQLFAGVVPRVTWIALGGFVFFGSCEACKTALRPHLSPG